MPQYMSKTKNNKNKHIKEDNILSTMNNNTWLECQNHYFILMINLMYIVFDSIHIMYIITD